MFHRLYRGGLASGRSSGRGSVSVVPSRAIWVTDVQGTSRILDIVPADRSSPPDASGTHTSCRRRDGDGRTPRAALAVPRAGGSSSVASPAHQSLGTAPPGWP